jgi:hypothetical protein
MGSRDGPGYDVWERAQIVKAIWDRVWTRLPVLRPVEAGSLVGVGAATEVLLLAEEVDESSLELPFAPAL